MAGLLTPSHLHYKKSNFDFKFLWNVLDQISSIKKFGGLWAFMLNFLRKRKITSWRLKSDFFFFAIIKMELICFPSLIRSKLISFYKWITGSSLLITFMSFSYLCACKIFKLIISGANMMKLNLTDVFFKLLYQFSQNNIVISQK